MKTHFRLYLLIALLLLAGMAMALGVGHVLAQGPIGTNFTYQGQLKETGVLANGPYDFQFSLYDAASGGSQVGSTLTRDDVNVTDGLFTVDLDFGDVFDGSERWLEIAVRPGDSTGAYTTLSPRQQLTAAPYALHARRFWKLGGNSNVGAGDYLGTSNNQSLELRVNGQRALLLIPDGASPNIIGGYSGNSVASGVSGAVISGGGESGNNNQVYDNYGTIGGGGDNQAGSVDNDATTAQYATVGGGKNNTASGDASTVGGGYQNTAGGYDATVGGGGFNTVSAKYATIAGGGPADENDPNNTNNQVYDDYGTIGGGGGNRAGSDDNDTTTAQYATVGGGGTNAASGNGATVGGGEMNIASGLDATVGGGNGNMASGWNATVGGGDGNTASGDEATVGGGQFNIASGLNTTVSGGVGNTASGASGTVGGGDGNSASGYYATVGGGASNTASGEDATVGGGNYNTASGDYATVPGGADNVAQGDYSFAAGRKARAYNKGCFVLTDSTDAYEDCTNDNRFVFRVTNAFYIWTKADHSAGVLLPTGGSAWSSLSDRNVKDNFEPVDGEDLLARLARIPILTWNYKAQDPAIRHMGPMAQDFYAAFGLGEDNRHISTIDADGVALAAIQALYRQNQQLRAENNDLKAKVDDLEARLAALEAAIAAMQENSAPAGGE